VPGVRAALIGDSFSAHQGVEDDDMSIMCLGAWVLGPMLAWQLIKTFLAAEFSDAERHRRCLTKVAELENKEATK
jgi:ribose 5-phosphate isomerase B